MIHSKNPPSRLGLDGKSTGFEIKRQLENSHKLERKSAGHKPELFSEHYSDRLDHSDKGTVEHRALKYMGKVYRTKHLTSSDNEILAYTSSKKPNFYAVNALATMYLVVGQEY